MELLQLWLAGSLGFALGWVVRSPLVRRTAERPMSELHEIDLRPSRHERPGAQGSGGRSTRTKTHTSYRSFIHLN